MSKTVQITKIGSITRVVETYSENPVNSRVLNISSGSCEISRDRIVFLGINLSFTFDELADKLGATDLVGVLDAFAELGYFSGSVGTSQNGSGFITLPITLNADIVQSDLLKNKSGIAMVVANGVVTQPVFGYDPFSGSFNLNVLSGEILTIFYNN